MKSPPLCYSVCCLYRGPDEIRYRIAVQGAGPQEIVISDSLGRNFARIHDFCEKHGLGIVEFVERLEAAAEDAAIRVGGGA